MMLTKEECEKALKNIALSYDAEYVNECNDEFCQAMKNYIKILENLIEQHFDNPPLKFEELKEGMFVWDNKHHTYIKIDRIWESYNKTIYFYAIGWECCENTEYEPNRFYRKEVKDV